MVIVNPYLPCSLTCHSECVPTCQRTVHARCHGDGMHCPAHLVIHIVEVRVDSTPPHLVEDGAVRTAHAKRQALSLAFANTGTSHWRKQPMNNITMLAAMNNITPCPSSTATPATFMYSVHHNSVLYRPYIPYL